jgi:hypothetical protein
MVTCKTQKNTEGLEFQMVIQRREIDLSQISLRINSNILDLSSVGAKMNIGEDLAHMLQIPLGQIKRTFCYALGKMGGVSSSQDLRRLGVK